jgi:hypothetical protein
MVSSLNFSQLSMNLSPSFLPEVDDLETVIINLGNWEKIVVKLILQHFPRVDRYKSYVM